MNFDADLPEDWTDLRQLVTECFEEELIVLEFRERVDSSGRERIATYVRTDGQAEYTDLFSSRAKAMMAAGWKSLGLDRQTVSAEFEREGARARLALQTFTRHETAIRRGADPAQVALVVSVRGKTTHTPDQLVAQAEMLRMLHSTLLPSLQATAFEWEFALNRKTWNAYEGPIRSYELKGEYDAEKLTERLVRQKFTRTDDSATDAAASWRRTGPSVLQIEYFDDGVTLREGPPHLFGPAER